MKNEYAICGNLGCQQRSTMTTGTGILADESLFITGFILIVILELVNISLHLLRIVTSVVPTRLDKSVWGNLCWFDYHHVPRKAYTELNLWVVECILTNIPFICFSCKRTISVVMHSAIPSIITALALVAYDKSSTLPSTMSIMIETFGLL